MGQATTLVLRERIISMREEGHTLKYISEELNVPYSTVKQLCRRFRERGISGLTPDYANCGPKATRYDVSHQEQVLKHRSVHPRWGAPRIRVEMQMDGEVSAQQADRAEQLPCIRTLQRWLRKAEAYRPRRQSSDPSIGRSLATHNIWEVDAKENLLLGDGTAACYLTIADEKSGAWLEAPVFPL